MNIYIDVSPTTSEHKHRGIGVYTTQLVKALREVKDKSVCFVENKKDADIVHYPYFDFFSHTLPIIKRKKTIVTIHDVIPLIFPDEYSPGIKGSIRFGLQKKAIQSVKAVITDSSCSKNDIYKHLSIPESRIFVTPLAAPDNFLESGLVNNPKNQKTSKPYILYVGDINYNKNIPQLIKAYAKSAIANHDLVLISRAMKNSHIPEARDILQTIEETKTKNNIRIITNASQQKLVNWYKNADWYIQPSLYEGFGLPILEAFASGIPVMSSNAGSLPEVVGNAGLFFDPKNLSQIVEIMRNAVNMDKKEKEKLISKGRQQLNNFSWKQTAKATLEVYKKVFESK